MYKSGEYARFLTRESGFAVGVKQIVKVATPVAGAEVSVTIPGGEQWVIMAGQLTFVAGAAVANRNVSLVVAADGVNVWRVQDTTALAATAAATYSVAMVDGPVSVASANGIGFLEMPLMPLRTGSTLSTLTTNLQALDQYSAINLYVARYFLTDAEVGDVIADRHREFMHYLAEYQQSQQPSVGAQPYAVS